MEESPFVTKASLLQDLDLIHMQLGTLLATMRVLKHRVSFLEVVRTGRDYAAVSGEIEAEILTRISEVQQELDKALPGYLQRLSEKLLQP